MMPPVIHLTPDPGALTLDVGAGALCVRHRDYAAPVTGEACRHVAWEDFAADPRAHLAGVSTLVVVGLSRIITPSNRTKVGPWLLRPLHGLQRITVDRTLFVVEPWRVWWHFGAVGVRYREYTYSYLAESHWRAAQDGAREDPFTLDAIVEAGRGVIQSHAPRYFEPLEIERVAVSPEMHARYAEEKARAFDEEHTPAAILRRLERIADEACPRRAIPTPARLFGGPSHRIVMTDLRVDAWLVSRLVALADLTNGIAERFVWR